MTLMHWRLFKSAPSVRRALSTLSPPHDALRLTRLTAYSVKLPLFEGSYTWADGKRVTEFDATVVRLETNQPGLVGWGEATPLGPNYLPAFAEGIRAGLPLLAEAVLGMNPLHLNNINGVMDKALKGHPYIKSAVDVACWDLRGKVQCVLRLPKATSVTHPRTCSSSPVSAHIQAHQPPPLSPTSLPHRRS